MLKHLKLKTFPFCTRQLYCSLAANNRTLPFKCTRRIICKTKATVASHDAWCLEMAGCHSERDTIPQLEDPGLSFWVGKHSPCLSILEQDTDPCQLYSCCSVADLLVEDGKQQRKFAFRKFITVIIVITLLNLVLLTIMILL